MANSIVNCLKEWGLQKIFTITVDNASSNDVTVKELYKKLTKWGTNSMYGTLLSSDWEDVKKLAKFLEIFYKLALKVSGSLYVTSNHYFLEICEVVVYLKQLILNENVLLGSIAKKMKEKFDKYWGDPEKINKMIFISYVLDLRYKFDSVSFALAKMFEEKVPIIAKIVHTYMTSLFDEIKRHKAGIRGSDSKSELEKYLTKEVENEIADSNILLWWKVNSPRFPILVEMTQDVLSIPISSVAPECAFSTGGHILDSFRSSLTPKIGGSSSVPSRLASE
uniref:Zinc finger BED domain-containing protein RICESLEEPER 3-like n=1 Tax=Nicotiana sylvestris TaxID=4096 RepID=A0A1U7W7Q3_NICSY|nr:PREDICTED: zinc finger BED domain-containing protein RICESLEEPER 3-like [Nicotiana sylvestris]